MSDHIKIICAVCRGENVKKDAWVEWNSDAGRWEVACVFDHAFCDDCEGETSTEVVRLPAPPDVQGG